MTRRHTEVAIDGEQFVINGQPTYAGITWRGRRIEGLLMNARMVQGIFDDLNPETRDQWRYPDTGQWDADRNTREFIAAMPLWRDHGLLAFTLNLQGGNPRGYASIGGTGIRNSAFEPDGTLRDDYTARLERILDRADQLGLIVILGLFYFGQEKIFAGDESAIRRAVDQALDWLLARDYRHVLIEVNNECDIVYETPILMPDRVHELIAQVRAHERGGRRLLVSTSYGGGSIPRPNVVASADYLLLHGNGVDDPTQIAAMVRQTRQVEGYRPMPIVFNEDDHFDFEEPVSNFTAAVGEYASWGYFDFRLAGEGYEQGYQSVPVDWGITSDRKRGFFTRLRQITQGE
jgi:hypothetical protein